MSTVVECVVAAVCQEPKLFGPMPLPEEASIFLRSTSRPVESLSLPVRVVFALLTSMVCVHLPPGLQRPKGGTPLWIIPFTPCWNMISGSGGNRTPIPGSVDQCSIR